MSGAPPSYAEAHNYPADPYKQAAYQAPPPPQAAYSSNQQGEWGGYGNPSYGVHSYELGEANGPYGNPGYNPAAYGQGQPAGQYGNPSYGPNTYGPGQPTAPYSSPAYGQNMHGAIQSPSGFEQPMTYHSNKEDNSLPKTDVNAVLFGTSFADKAIRRGFIRKVYLILFTQLLVTFGTICLFIFVKDVKRWVQNHLWFYLLAYGLFLVLYFTLVCCPGVRRQSPGNWICLGLFTLAFSYMTAAISSFHDTDIVLLAAGITAALCLAISVFAIQTKIDFTMCSGLLFVLVMVLFFFGWACLITYYAFGASRILNCVYGALAALVFGLFLIYDTQQVMGGRKYELSPEEYIYGALQLYIDIVYIFIIILGFMGNK